MNDKKIRQEQDSKFRLSRLNIFLFDFQQAYRFAKYILRRKWPKVISPQSRSELVYLAFNTSLIISYSRPFHNSRDGAGLPDARLNIDLMLLSDGERALHKSVLAKRDQTYAHSDSSAHEIDGLHYSASSVHFYKLAFEPLTKPEILLLTKMIRKWISYVEDQRSEVRDAMSPRVTL